MDNALVFGETPKKKPARKPAAKKVAKPVVDEVLGTKPVKMKETKSGWPIIVIDEVDNAPNFEVVGVNGNVFQIMRGVEVPVPPEVFHVLQNAVGERIIQMHDPAGGVTTKRQKYAAIPWRVVGYVP